MKLVGICYFVLCLVVQVYSEGCSLPLAVSDEQHLPVLVDNSGSDLKLAVPHLGNVELNVGDTILLTCPNSGNKLVLTSTVSAEAVCVSGETIEISNEKQDYQSVLCSKGLRGTAVTTDTECAAGSGYIINIGFPEEDQFLKLIEVCYDANNGISLYTTHLLYGTEINAKEQLKTWEKSMLLKGPEPIKVVSESSHNDTQYIRISVVATPDSTTIVSFLKSPLLNTSGNASTSSYRPSFSVSELPSDIAANVAYTQASQKSVFNLLLGSAELAEQYINSKSYLARGHLSPDADFLFASWQYSTYFFVNAVPQWQAINNANWKKIENLCKNTAATYGETLRVYTGTYGVLSLPDVNNIDTEIHLSNDKLPVPKFMWKILHSEISGKAIAFVTINNPFLTELTASDRLCTDICDSFGWSDDAWSNGAKGFIYCCDARDLLDAIPTGPEVNIDGILTASASLSTKFGRFGYRRQGGR